jgi:protein-S-isoprenylcysteine O-methyltransferase Ste14
MRLLSSLGFGIYAAHAAFWGAFVITRLTVQTRDQQEQGGKAGEARASTADSAAHSRVLVAVHGLAFVVLYVGLGIAVLGGHSVALFRSQPIAALVVIGAAAALCCCALLYLRSWRFRAAVSVGHELATGGPFRFLRHPIYMGLNLLALGSALWIPTPIVWLSFVLMCIGGDLRARAEEALLVRTYGRTYESYCTRTRRFLPGLY